jgi:hypothetical protein
MTPERAKELLNHRTVLIGSVSARTIDVGDIRKHMTEKEISAVNAVWNTLDGNTSFCNSLWRIANP